MNTVTNLPRLMLTLGFIALISWFSTVDVYHHDFFTSGKITLLYNTCRTLFALYIAWMVYAAGYFALSTLVSAHTWNSLPISERLVAGFSAGTGCTYLVLFALGLFNLYYWPLLAALCVITLWFSGGQFQLLMTAIRQSSFSFTTLFIACAIFWLLLVRGLYPAGGHDYYTHYFYYYLNVVKNHGLTPNDVWYHFYYSKGAGLFFLGMILTDPLAPSLITFGFVMVTTLALISLVNRLAPRSLWPAFCASLYVFYNLAALSGDGGDFQKIHEITSSLIILAIWGVCMLSYWPAAMRKSLIFTLASLTLTMSILTQATTIFIGAYFAVLACFSFFQRKTDNGWLFTKLMIFAGTTVCAIFALNFYVTGLYSDQSLNLMWRHSNIERLNNLGLLPNIMIGEWIRDNIATTAKPWGMSSVYQLIAYVRADVLKIALVSMLIPVSILLLQKWQLIRRSASQINILYPIGIALITFAILALVLGHDQVYSFMRFSSFFLPLTALFITACWCYALSSCPMPRVLSSTLYSIMPALLLVMVLHSWNNWPALVRPVTKHGLRFMSGQYSIADAYAHEPTGYAFGGINPGVLAAAQQAPVGARIWSTNIASYCMAPDCQIESVVSFKLSSRMNDILNGSPEEAKQILRQEKLNYFLFADEYPIRDILAYSELFAPQHILKHLAVAWTDGKTYLLTWRTQPITPQDKTFLQVYAKHYQEDDHDWFNFHEARKEMKRFMGTYASMPHPWRPIEFPWAKRTNQAAS